MPDNTTKQIFAKNFLRFLHDSPTPHHAVREMKKRLDTAGFVELSETARWRSLSHFSMEKTAPNKFESSFGGKYYVTRGGTSLIAFVMGDRPLEQTGFKIIGAHTDSPTLRLKPNVLSIQAGCSLFGVEPYGGGIWNSWTNKNLFIAGRVTARNNGVLSSHLVNLRNGPILSIPSLPIHLHRDVNEAGGINSQIDLPAIAGLEDVTLNEFHNLIKSQASDEVISTALSLCSAEKGILSGMHREFIRAGQLDNLASCYEALCAMIETKYHEATTVAAFWDNEEVGSSSAQGAAGSFLKDILNRIIRDTETEAEVVYAKSFLISSDMAHAVLPHHQEKFEPKHMPRVGGGPVIKWNANLRYVTNDVSAAIFANLCDVTGVKYQQYVNRSDLPCGSTIGSIVSPLLGINTVDVGGPMWAMHSISEQMGVEDLYSMYEVFKTFYTRGREKVLEF